MLQRSIVLNHVLVTTRLAVLLAGLKNFMLGSDPHSMRVNLIINYAIVVFPVQRCLIYQQQTKKPLIAW